MKKKILIVEDDKMLCKVFEMFLNDLGYQLTGIAKDSKTALLLCQADMPDVVLMDIHLDGDVDGIDTAKQISDLFNIPVVFVSSDIEESTILRAIYHNTYGFLVKPIYKNSLKANIEFAAARHKFNGKS